MFDKLEGVEFRYKEIERKLQDPALTPADLKKYSKEHSSLTDLVQTYREYRTCKSELESSRELMNDNDESMRAIAKEEINRLEPLLFDFEQKLKILLLPKDPNDDKNIILEVRAGAGGNEAALFVADLFRMYQRYSEKRGWRVELLSANSIGIGGFKEIVAMITGDKVFSKLKNEAGVHRVQRVPDTEAQGRIHTSTVTVAVLPEAEEVDVKINPNDLRIDVFRAGGPGGQSVNTTDSAVRITHIPTGVVVSCQDEKSQLKNKEKAFKILRARILESEREKAAAAEAAVRRSMVGTGDRSERIRTYNFPQSRVTDHRINITLHTLPDVMNGDVGPLIDALIAHQQAELLKQTGSVL